MIERVEIPARGLVFDALVAGPADGPLVLCLHGFPQTSAGWRGVLAALGAAGYRAVAPDQRGYSPRARPAERRAYRMAELVADVLAMADHLGAGRFHLAGHDWGGAVAWEVAGRHPDRVRTLTAVSTPHPAAMVRSLLTSDQLWRSGYIGLFRTPGLAEWVLGSRGLLRKLLLRSGLDEAMTGTYLAALRAPGALTAALNWYRAAISLRGGPGRISVPTLYVWSDNDPALGPRAARTTGRWVDGPYTFEVIAGGGHWLPERHAGQLSGMMLQRMGGADDGS